MWYIYALLSGFFAAVVAILTKIYLKHHNPFFVTLIFSMVTIVMLLVMDLVTKKINCHNITSLTLKEFLPLIITGCINGLSFTFYLAALKCGKTGSVVAVDRLGILFVLILSLVFLQESMTIKSVIGGLMMVAGAVVLSL